MQSPSQELGHLRASSLDHHQSLLPKTEGLSSEQSHSTSNPPIDHETTSYKSSSSGSYSIPWKLEILSWIGSLCFFIAIIVVLKVLNGRPLPDLQYGITPNAIIGLLATFGQALLISPVSSALGQMKWLQALEKRPMNNFETLDKASRGPLGSTLLIAGRKSGYVIHPKLSASASREGFIPCNSSHRKIILTETRPVASLGAIITIVALGISTFTQQSLKYNTIYPHTDEAYMPIAQFINGSGYAPIGDGGRLRISGVDREVLNAPYIAFFSPAQTNFTAASTARCESNNCTWDSYQTLGLRSTCKDLSSTLNMTKVYMAPYDGDSFTYNTDYYTLPNGFGLTGAQPGALVNQVYYPITNGILNVTTSLRVAGLSDSNWESIAFAQNGSALISVFAVGAAFGTIPIQPDMNYTRPMNGSLFAPPVAYECLLQFCVRNMRAEVMNATIHETELSTWANQSLPSTDPVYKYHDMTLQPPGSSTTFVITNVALGGLSTWLQYLLEGNVTIVAETNAPEGWTLDESQSYSSSLIQPVYTAMNNSPTGFPDMMDNLVNSISLNLRQIPYQPPPVRGQAFTATSHAVVTWEWLILPFFELAGSLVFLIIVIIQTRQGGLSVPWTNSTLAYFFHGLDKRPVRGVVYTSEEKMAEDLEVKLERDSDGGHLVIVK